MPLKIEKDLNRFHKIVRGKIKENLQKYVTSSEMIGKKGNEMISIPIPSIELPRFVYGDNEQSGVGQGEGQDGDPVDGEPGEGAQAGNAEGQHLTEVELSFEELAEIIGETLELPNIEPKGHADIVSESRRYKSISMTGPESLRHFKRTYRQALRRMLASKTYNPKDPKIIPVKEDRRYRMFQDVEKPEHKAVILFMLDVSGSMGQAQKEIVRLETFWIDTWLRKQYHSVDVVYIIHDAVAREVDRETFFHTRESGGTNTSSAYNLRLQII